MKNHARSEQHPASASEADAGSPAAVATASDDVPSVRRLIHFIDRECIER